MESSGGWYNTRRQYRSVAFGTWKVGGARQLSQKSSSTLCSSIDDSSTAASTPKFNDLDANRNFVLNRGYNTIAVTPRARKKEKSLGVALSRPLGESSPNLSRLPLGVTFKKMEPLRVESLAALSVSDCYSSSEYCEYTRSREDLDSNGNSADVVERLPRRPTTRGAFSFLLEEHLEGEDWRLATSLQRVHQRSRSAGADAAWSLSTLASTRHDNSAMKIKGDTTNGNAGPHYASSALRATKRFFKKIYSTATLPSKKNSVTSPPPAPVSEKFRVFAPFFDAALQDERFRVEMDDEEEIGVRTEGFENDHVLRYDTRLRLPSRDTRDDERIRYSDRSSTPNESIGSATMTSKSEVDAATDPPPPQPPPESWDDVFLRLKREIVSMRERDAAILADLQRVDLQLQSVKASRAAAAFLHMPDPEELQPGDLVPSIPL